MAKREVLKTKTLRCRRCDKWRIVEWSPTTEGARPGMTRVAKIVCKCKHCGDDEYERTG